MKLRTLFIFLSLGAGILRAEFDLDALIKVAKGSTRNAPAIIADAASENPQALLKIVSYAVLAMPERSVEIVQALLKVYPKQAAEIVKAAIQTSPKLADKIVPAAIAMYPEFESAIRTAAEEAGNEVETAVAKPSEPGLGRGRGDGASAAPVFPVQPIRPDLVSPSS